MNRILSRHSCNFAPLISQTLLILALSATCWSQEPPPQEKQKPAQDTQTGMSGGASTAGAHPPVKDELSRPITAGAFEKRTIIETPGAGVAFLDYDNDGWMDIFLLNGSTFNALKGLEPAPKAMLFHNNHDGTFTDVTEKAGVANERW